MNIVIFCWQHDQKDAKRVQGELRKLLPDSRIIIIKQRDVTIDFDGEQYFSELSGAGCNHNRIHEFRWLFENLDHFIKVDPDCHFRSGKIFEEMKSRSENVRGLFVRDTLTSCCCYFDRTAIKKILEIPVIDYKTISEDAHWDKYLIPEVTIYNLTENFKSYVHPFPHNRTRKKPVFNPSAN